ncbi:MAG TPA: S9 family peptidase [Pyrinomonadaceae bacterium]|jgi:dipeptidyl aminopeptidase/acylaminoacyl peptidase|nr:S9 family peptidase [Pyrinomonadaceae bacterium]
MMRARKRFLLAAPLLLFALSFVNGQPRQLTPADILRVATVSDAQISPSGEWIVYSLATVEANETASTLWIVRAGERFPSGPPTSRQPEPRRNWESFRFAGRALLPPGWNASNARWSPDGKNIAFLATHEGQRGIWLTGPTRAMPRYIAEVRDTNYFITYAEEPFAWSPDSRMIAYVSASEEEFNKSDDPRVIDRIQYKSRTSFSDRLRTHIWIADIDAPQPRQLTSGMYYDHALSFSPRGDEIAFLSNHEPDPDANNNSDIFAVNLQGQLRQITATAGCEYEPTWSPDGKWIAYTATKRDVTTIDSVAEDTHVWIVSATGDVRRELTASQDRRARNPRWQSDSRAIYFLANDHGQTLVFRTDLNGDKIDPVFGAISEIKPVAEEFKGSLDSTAPTILDQRMQTTSFSLAQQLDAGEMISGEARFPIRAASMAAVISDPTHPGEVWIGRGNTLIRITYHNDGFRRAANLIEPQEFRFRTFDGTETQGWIIKPAGWREDRKYPLLLNIHGGPHGMYGYAFNANFQIMAARGYAVLYLNPRGSNGYGQRFSDGSINEWGGGDYRDLMAGVDEALRKFSWIDQSKLGVTGGSYGGFMTNWIITQTPRFKAAVSVASVSNLISFYSTSLYQDLIHAEFGGFPWDNYELLWQWSPMRYVRQVQTPTMLIHGEQDNDVPVTQAEEMYMALRRRGVDSVFVRYPREGHGLREPKHRVDALERTLEWFDKYLK